MIPLKEASSTAAAAKEISDGDGTTAAIAAPGAAWVYGLVTLADNIQDNDYQTNFWVVVSTSKASFDVNPNHLIIALDVPSGSQAFSSTVQRMQDAGFYVVNVNSTPFGNLYSYRYLIRLKSNSKLQSALQRVNTVLKAVQRSGASALLIGAYRR